MRLAGVALAAVIVICELGSAVLAGSPAAIVTLLLALTLMVGGVFQVAKQRRREANAIADALLNYTTFAALVVAIVISVAESRIDHAAEVGRTEASR